MTVQTRPITLTLVALLAFFFLFDYTVLSICRPSNADWWWKAGIIMWGGCLFMGFFVGGNETFFCSTPPQRLNVIFSIISGATWLFLTLLLYGVMIEVNKARTEEWKFLFVGISMSGFTLTSCAYRDGFFENPDA